MKAKLALLYLILFPFSFLLGQQVTIQLSFSQKDLDFIKIGSYDFVKLGDGNAYYLKDFVGKPQLGVKNFNVLIPPNCEIKDIKYKINSEEQLKGKYFIYPVQYLNINNGDKPQPFVDPDPLIYNSKRPYPENITKSYSLCIYRDYSYANISIIPFKYIPSERDLFLLTDITVTIEYKQKVEVSNRKRQRDYNEIDEIAFESIKKRVKNQSDVYTFYSEFIGKLKKTKSSKALLKNRNIFSPTSMPSTTGSEVEYVIITNNYDVNGRFVGNLAELFQDFADWKTKTGIPAKVVQIDDIKNHYAGCDLQEKIREFIKDAFVLWGTEYVLLGGDVNVVPARCIPYGYTTTFMPSDLYYSDIIPLNSNWNANGNNIFCEYNDLADQTQDIMVGRAPVESASELNTFLDKNYTYDRCSKAQYLPDASYLEKQLNLGGILWPANWNANDNEFGLWVTYQVWGLRDPNKQYTLMEYKNSYPSDWAPAYNINPGNYLRAGTALTELNKGYGIISHNDHSDWNCLGTGATEQPKQWVTSSDLMQLTNGRKCGVLYSAGCRTAPFDMEDCVGEKWLLNNNGGGVAYIGTATEIYSNNGGEHNRLFFQELVTNNIHTIGTILNEANASSMDIAYSSRIYQLLSDPELQVFTTQPNNLTVNYNQSIPLGKNTFEITLSGIPVGLNARICLMKNNEVYEYGSFGNGTQIFNITLDSPGQMYLTVTAPNCQPYEGIVNVTNTSGGHLYVTDINVNDCKTYIGGACNGNGDGQIDAGETIELVLKVKNSGLTKVTETQAQLSCSSPYINLGKNISTFPALNPGEEAFSNTFLIYVTPNAPDRVSVPFTLSINDINGNPLPEEVFYLKLSAPNVDLVETVINDGGNGFQAGETIELNFKLNNIGNSIATGINAVLWSTSPNISNITQSTSSFSNIVPFSDQYNQQPFRFCVSNSYSGGPIEFSLNLLDAYGKAWSFDVNLTRPSTVTNIRKQSYQNEIEISWTPIAGVKGYNIYRSQTIDGEYIKLNKLIIQNSSLFRDYGIPSKTVYYYKVSSISNSGVESSLSLPIKAWTLLPMLANWPILPEKSGIIWGGITLSDVDNDGYKDIFTNNLNGMVLAWNQDGTELFNIDNNPTTVDGFYDLNGKGLWSVPAIGDIDKDGKKEIVVTTRNPGDIYVFKTEDNNGDGKPDIRPGWPQHIDNGDANLHGAVISDLNGDGYLEIIAHSENGSVYKVFSYDGSNYSGWPKILSIPGPSYGMPAVADLDNDGFKEIIEGFADGNLYIWRHDGSNFSKFPFLNISNRKLLMPPVVVDIDKDGTYEIFILAGNGYSANLYAFTPSGNIKSGWNGKSLYLGNIAVNDLFPCIAVGDLDQNGTLEVVYASGSSIYVWDSNGNNWNLPGQTVFPITHSDIDEQCTHPLLADVDGDNQLEIIVPTFNSGYIYAFKCDGSIPVGWPLPVLQDFTAEPAIDDINNDGKSEIVIGDGSGHVYVYQTDGRPALIDVGHYRFDNQNTGVMDKYKEKREAGTINASKNWSGYINVFSDVTIPLGVTLTIDPGTHIRFTNNSSLIVNNGGTLNAPGTTEKKIVMDFVSISFSPINRILAGAGSNIDLRGVEIKNAASGLWTTSANIYVDNCDFHDMYKPFYLINNSNRSSIINSYIRNSSSEAIWLNGSNAYLFNNKISNNNGEGVRTISYTDVDLLRNTIEQNSIGISVATNSSGRLMGYNLFRNNSWNSLYAKFNGVIEAGEGNNTFNPITGNYVRAEYTGYVYAGWNYWGQPSPDPNKFYVEVGSYIDTSNYLTNDPGAGSTLPKTGKQSDLRLAFSALMKGEYDDAGKLFKKVIKEKFNENESRYALSGLASCYRRSGKDGFKQYLTDEVKPAIKNTKDDIYRQYLDLYTNCLTQEGSFDEALENLKAIRDNYKLETEQRKELDFQEGYITLVYQNNIEKAKPIFEKMKNDYPDQETKFVVDGLISAYNSGAFEAIKNGELKDNIGKNQNNRDNYRNKKVPDDFDLYQNYPNPFNPSTIISYALQKQSQVELKIYNIMGNEVRSFTINSQSAGYHNLQWDGKNFSNEPVSSGIYIYKLRAVSYVDGQVFEKSAKMMLVK